jgi:glycosyltransferase involved in cell wall biosynthesis
MRAAGAEGRSPVRVAVVLWNGNPGGAEAFSVSLIREFRRRDVDVRAVFVCDPDPLARDLAAADVPHATLGLKRGRNVLRNARRFARSEEFRGAEVALLVSPGFLAAALRIGGFPGQIVTVNHDTPAQALPLTKRAKRFVDRLSGSWASDVDVAVSDFVLERLRGRPHARRIVRIHNGVDIDSFAPGPPSNGRPFTVGWAGRLVAGKGVEELLRAFADLPDPARLRIAGDGPERASLEAGARSLGLEGRVSFEGWVRSVPEFWRGCDAGAMPTNRLLESFGMAAVEAMATGLPVVATRNGALPEIVEDGQSGLIVEPGDRRAFAKALDRYRQDSTLRRAHGERARNRCEERFDLKRCAVSYLDLFASLPARPRGT